MLRKNAKRRTINTLRVNPQTWVSDWILRFVARGNETSDSITYGFCWTLIHVFIYENDFRLAHHLLHAPDSIHYCPIVAYVVFIVFSWSVQKFRSAYHRFSQYCSILTCPYPFQVHVLDFCHHFTYVCLKTKLNVVVIVLGSVYDIR